MFNASIIYFVILFASQTSYFSSYSYTLPYFFFSPPCFSFHRKKKTVRFSPSSRTGWRRTRSNHISNHKHPFAFTCSSFFFAPVSRRFLLRTFEKSTRKTTGDDRERVSFLRGNHDFCGSATFCLRFCIMTNKLEIFDKGKRIKQNEANAYEGFCKLLTTTIVYVNL